MAIDLHTHMLPRSWPSWTQRSGYAGWIELAHDQPGCSRMLQTRDVGPPRAFRDVTPALWEPSHRLADMEATGIATQVLSTVPVMFSYWARPTDAYDLSRLLNDHLAEVCRSHPPGRFIALGTAPLQSPDLACRELDRCVRDLGMPGLQIGTNVNGMNLDDPFLAPVLHRADELGAALFVHPWEMLHCSTHAAMPASGPKPEPSPVDRLGRYWSPWLIGMPAETTIAIAAVIFGGILDRYPRIRWCFAHGGGSFPGTVGRLAHGRHARPDLFPPDAPDPLATLARGPTSPARFWVDSLVHEPHALRLLLTLFGSPRVALGSDYPFPLGEAVPGALARAMLAHDPASLADVLEHAARSFLHGASTPRATLPS